MSTGDDAITGEAGERYARALFELADEAKTLEQAEKDMAALGAALSESDELRRFVKSPVFSREDKAKALTKIGDKLGLSDLTKNFVSVVARNGRSGDLLDTVRVFKRMAAKRRGAVSADIASADTLTAAQLKELTAALKSALGQEVEVRTEVNPELIGGLVIKVGSKMFDSSLLRKLEGMRNAMKEA